MAVSEPTPIIDNGLYDRLKFIAQILLPALATLYFAVDTIWELGFGTKVVGTITAVDTFLGVVLQLSTKNYYKSGANFDGDVVVTPEDGGTRVGIAAERPLEDIVDDPGKHSVEFRIVQQGTETP